MTFHLRSFALLLGLIPCGTVVACEGLKIPDNPLWETIVDEVYLQEIPTLISTDQPLAAVAVFDGQIWVGDRDGVRRVTSDSARTPASPATDGAGMERVDGVHGEVRILKVLDGILWAAGPNGLWQRTGDGWVQITEQPVHDLCAHNGGIVVASEKDLLVVENDQLRPLTQKGERVILGVASYSGTLYVHDGKELGMPFDDRVRFGPLADWGRLEPGCEIRDICSVGSRLYVATNEGLNVLRGMTWYQITGEDGLCYEDTTSLTVGFDRDLWIGTTRGAIRNVNGDYQFFGHERWIPHDHVNAIATGTVAGQKTACIATDGGLSIIRYEPFTLARKAAYYERWLNEWGMKRLGFIHILFLEDGQWVREVSDNDVGYSSHYMSVKCLEYAVTGSEAARAAAVDMMKTVKWSEEITSIDGFPARSIYAVGELTHKAQHGSGGLPAEWHATPDNVWEWKGDTSSDEVDAHVYATTQFLKLVANDDERVWATDHLRRVVGHIVDNGYVLRDVDGKPTRWARWDEEYLQSPRGSYARGLNGLEAVNYLTAAHHHTGDAKFATAKLEYLGRGYQSDILRQKLTFHPGYFTHFDDRLAFYSYYPLIQFETDTQQKSLWLRSLERSWEIKRSEGVPWFHFIYGALTGNDCETRRAVEHLRGWPLDLRRWSYMNSHRDDLHMPNGYRVYSERPKPLNPRETAPNRWDGDFMRLDETYGGRMVADPGGWLDAYWMGRYYGMITAPTTDDPNLISVSDRDVRFGAAPYDGPVRPKLRHEQ